jgi:hypothetical protein
MKILLPSNLKSECEKKRIRNNCFKAAAELIQQLQIKDVLGHHRLVHGNLASLNQDKPVNHAWMEELDFVYDFSGGNKRLFMKENYYLDETITKVKKYTAYEAQKWI